MWSVTGDASRRGAVCKKNHKYYVLFIISTVIMTMIKM